MALEPAITDLEQLKDRPELARLLAWKADAVQGAKFDRNELTIYIERTFLREACTHAQERSGTQLRLAGRSHLRGLDAQRSAV